MLVALVMAGWASVASARNDEGSNTPGEVQSYQQSYKEFTTVYGYKGHSQAAPEVPEDISTKLSSGIYCSLKHLLEGNIGLLAGLVLVFLGIWGLINGGSLTPALIIIVIGGLITALPTLVESGFSGLGDLLYQTNISGKTYDPPACN